MWSTTVTTGLAIGGSLGLGQIAELPDDNKLVRELYKTKHRAAITSTVLSLGVAFFVGPVAGVISEFINYPCAMYKVHKIKKRINDSLPYTMPTRTASVGSLEDVSHHQLKGILCT